MNVDELRQDFMKNQHNDGTHPLRPMLGFRHKPCGGEAERYAPPAYLAYCWDCNRSVPVQEVERIGGA